MVDSMICIFGSELTAQTSFSSNGLGVLSEAISCTVIEELNGGYEVELEYPVSGKNADAIVLRNIIVVKPNPFSNPQPFRIYSISKPLNGIITVNAEHISYDLSGYVAQVLTTPAAGIQDYFSQLSSLATPSGCPFSFWTNSTASDEFKVHNILPIRSILGKSGSYVKKEENPSGRISLNDVINDGYILDIFPGEYEWDGLTVKHYRVIEDEHGNRTGGRGEDRGVSIRYGKNLTSFKQDQNCQKVYTAIYPYWHYTGYRHDLIELPNKLVTIVEGADYAKVLPMDLTSVFARRPSEEDMENYVKDYIKKNDLSTPEVSFDVSFVPLSQTEEYKDYAILETVKLGDTVHVVFPLMGVTASAKVERTAYDALTDKYESITLGSYKNGVADLVVSQGVQIQNRTTPTNLETAILDATERLTGQTGGYVVMNTYSSQTTPSGSGDNSDGTPNEILIMDRPDMYGENAAQNVWRWNVNGLGFSPNGVQGPYTIAITSDGQINADFITAGYISGERIQAGSITANQISVEYTGEVDAKITASANALIASMSALQQAVEGQIESATQYTSQVAQSVDELNIRFEEQAVGGINKIQNSSGLNGLTDWLDSGTVAVIDQEGSDAGKAFQLSANGSLRQTIATNEGEMYAVSYRVKNTAGSYISLTGVRGEVDNKLYLVNTTDVFSDLTLEFTTFVASSSSVVIDIHGALTVADFMITPGSSKCNWTPAPNEIYTANVKVDKRGINITNSSSDTQTLIDNTQFAVLHQGEVVLTVNKEETQLQKTTVREALSIGKGQFVPVDGGVDFVILD